MDADFFKFIEGLTDDEFSTLMASVYFSAGIPASSF